MINDKGEEVGIIYGWYNTKGEKWYIGQTVNPEGRFNCHIRLSLNNDMPFLLFNMLPVCSLYALYKKPETDFLTSTGVFSSKLKTLRPM